MQITEQLIERIARNVFRSMFSQELMNANVVTGNTIDHADKADESKRLGDETVGSATNLFYLDDGTPTESNASVGDSSTPVYIDGGTFTACTGVATSNDISDINDDISDINDEIVDIWDAIHDLQPTQ
jgi:hypothetical protein